MAHGGVGVGSIKRFKVVLGGDSQGLASNVEFGSLTVLGKRRRETDQGAGKDATAHGLGK